MLEIEFGGCQTNCEGVRRRDFLKVGALTGLGLSLPDLLRLEAGAPSKERRREISCILLWLNGGPSHLDTFDPKPDAPAEIRGEFGTIPTAIPGVRFCEHLPRLARQLDKFSILRSVTSPENGHERATHYLLTGYKFNLALEYPSYGSVVTRELGSQGEMPAYVLMGSYPFGYGGAGYMGGAYNPFSLDGNPSQANFRVHDLTPPGGVTLERIRRRKNLLESIDAFHQRFDASAVRDMDAFYDRAYDLVTSPRAKRAFDLALEPQKVRERYGSTSFGQSCLLARRLIEGGVRFVTINLGGWDTHQDNFSSLKGHRLPELDLGYSALLEDLAARDLLESTLVICMGEFGRPPTVNPSAGRDHWAQAMTVCLGGGGVKTGLVIGETNERAEEPKERPIRVEDVAATIYNALGIPCGKEYRTPQNRPVKINYDGQAVAEVL
ncbi:MAG: DUF1501 domain-containing protein [Planctomycetes bacterium]|nr:DUF1501 domain-containing protein [Planctomycetota bacterium]